MPTGDQDKTEDPSAYRLEEARKRGEAAKSTDAVGVSIMVAFAVAYAMTAAWVMQSLAHALRQTMLMAGARPALDSGLVAWMGDTWFPLWQSLTPLVMTLVVVAVVANVAQTGPMFSTHPLSPDFNRLNPAQTIKRLFSMRTLWDLGKMLLKMLLLAALCFVVFGYLEALVAGVAMAVPQRLPVLALSFFVSVSVYVLTILVLIALFDVLMTRREFMRRMRTSRREMRDEIKRRDGDPEVKSKQKRLIRDLLKKARAVPRAAEADVILTNPTHCAIALQYRPATMRAPVVLAKGYGFMARRIRHVASRAGVPVFRSPELARAIYRECDVDAPVPETLYAQLAPVYRWLFGARRARVAV